MAPDMEFIFFTATAYYVAALVELSCMTPKFISGDSQIFGLPGAQAGGESLICEFRTLRSVEKGNCGRK